MRYDFSADLREYHGGGLGPGKLFVAAHLVPQVLVRFATTSRPGPQRALPAPPNIATQQEAIFHTHSVVV